MIRTKIIATIGPSSEKPAVLRKMINAGLDIARLNFSHGTHAEHIKKILTIRSLNKKMRRSIKIMQDLEGYRIRIGDLPRPITFKKRARFQFIQADSAKGPSEIPFSYRGSLKIIKRSTSIFVEDGKIVFKVKDVGKNELSVEATTDGVLRAHKGMNFPGVRFPFSSITDKDKKAIKAAQKYKPDYIAQSFVRTAKDVKELRRMVHSKDDSCKIFAKIECREALENIGDIIEEADGIIVARGDLGISVPIYKVPVIQKEIIEECLFAQKPVVVATQMLESMTESTLPTRAEVSDVANAILDGATHTMLSGETTIGLYPDLAVDMMNKIAKDVEEYQLKRGK
ncbi:MAG: pyruvate kinase [Candidatus Omnitrophota bacterium]